MKQNIEKNVARSSSELVNIEDDFIIITHKNNSDSLEEFKHQVDSSYIQFHFCAKGNGIFVFNNGNYRLPLSEQKSLLLYNPQQDLPLHLQIAENSWLVSILVHLKKFHTLFSQEASYVDFLSEENKSKKYYKDGVISPSTAVVLNQMLNFNLHESVRDIYLKGKAYELIGLYFNHPDEPDVEQCPFLADEENVRKIKMAKQLIIEHMAEPPTLQELSEKIGLSLKKLKEGFKEIYGDTVYGFLVDYKLEYARSLLEKGQHNVNEVGLKIGYSTSSHFIAAFKKKFGITPKQYMQTQN
ncbi:helix-turn-helix transcriptional regulator [Gangjinia marincola]|uniref:Helix-turn-helix transcriptional regulator n=1 Tax=Gangjinia marincola TaxID=578463 RepID=A0ABN1MI48_9FLAO